MKTRIEIPCPFCKASFKRSKELEEKKPLLFCAYCGARLKQADEKIASSPETQFSSVYVKEHIPDKKDIQGSIGQYLLLKSLAKGGMGEVFLAFDTISGRQIALKRIRPDFVSTPLLKQRFLKEARITSQLIHPSIIPIYNIHIDGDLAYYTMPYVQGKTLRQLLQQAKTEEENGEPNHTSVISLMRIFLTITQAIAYAHSRGILHRDIKPENIIIGQYGQIIILDWGLTKLVEEDEEVFPDTFPNVALTRVGKLVGTVAYMAPERAKGQPASVQTDIYALGVILYQILTLTIPFKRKNIPNFLSSVDNEQYVPPEIRAPYRDIPKALSDLVKGCLEKEPSKRIQNTDTLVQHVENFLEGKSEWVYAQSLDVERKSDWQLQENILFSEYSSLLQQHESSDWHRIMISSHAFSDNVRIKLKLTLQKGSQGIGILLAIPDEKERQSLTDGYCLWLSTEKNSEHPSMLLRSSVLVLEAPDVILQRETQHELIVEKIDQFLTVFLDGHKVVHHTSHIPVVGAHVGLLAKDSLFSIQAFDVSVGSQNIIVNCLAVPDAFLATGAYEQAYISYNRLADLFSGRAEGREALFRAGIALLEMGKQKTDPDERAHLLNKSLSQFQRLRNTAGAPLEYLGKAYVYQATREFEEEAKCFELAFRRYSYHPYLWMLHEQLVARLHELSKTQRVAASRLLVLALRFLPETLSRASTKKMLVQSTKEWEWPPFFCSDCMKNENKETLLLALSFWLRSPFIANEQVENLLKIPVLPKEKIEIAFLTLRALDNDSRTTSALQKAKETLSKDEQTLYKDLFFLLEQPENSSLALIANTITPAFSHDSLFIRAALVLLDLILQKDHSLLSQDLLSLLSTNAPLFPPLTARLIELFLLKGLNQEAAALLHKAELVNEIDEKSPLFFFKGYFIAEKEGEHAAVEFFQTASDIPFPSSWCVAAHVISGKIQLKPKGWLPRAYPYEIDTLERHLRLFSQFSSRTYLPIKHI